MSGIASGDVRRSGVPHAQLLIDFAEAVVTARSDDAAALGGDVAAALGAEGLVDAAGVIATFNAIVRVADASGIPLEQAKREASVDIRAELGIDTYRETQ